MVGAGYHVVITLDGGLDVTNINKRMPRMVKVKGTNGEVIPTQLV